MTAWSRTAYKYDRFFIEYTFTGLKQYSDFQVGFQWERTPKNSYDSFPLVGIKFIEDNPIDAGTNNVIFHVETWELYIMIQSYSKDDMQDYLNKLRDLVKLFIYEHPNYLHTYQSATFHPLLRVWMTKQKVEFGTLKYKNLLIDSLTTTMKMKWQETITMSSTPLIDLPDPTTDI